MLLKHNFWPHKSGLCTNNIEYFNNLPGLLKLSDLQKEMQEGWFVCKSPFYKWPFWKKLEGNGLNNSYLITEEDGFSDLNNLIVFFENY